MSEIQPWHNPKTDPNPVRRSAAAVLQGTAELERRGWLRAWWPAFFWAGFIFVMSTDTFSYEHTGWFLEPLIRWIVPSLTKTQVALVHYCIRKSAHFTEYFIFCSLLYRGIRGSGKGWRWTWALAAWFIAASYSALDEIHQIFVASRQARVTDSLLDSTGALFAIVALYLWFRRQSAKTPVAT